MVSFEPWRVAIFNAGTMGSTWSIVIEVPNGEVSCGWLLISAGWLAPAILFHIAVLYWSL